MSAPNPPSDFRAVIPDPASNLCANFKAALIQLPILVYKFMAWMLDESGNLTEEFKREIVKPGDLIFSASPLLESASRLLCDGGEEAQASYPALFAAIGTTYGTPSETDRFKLPDFRARFPVGIGDFETMGTAALGVTGGEDKVRLTPAQTPVRSHSHQFPQHNDDDKDHTEADTATGYFKTDGAGIVYVASAAAGSSPTRATEVNDDPATPDVHIIEKHPNLPPWFACYVYIKT